EKHDVIMTPENPVYFDHSQSKNDDSLTIGGYNPLEKVYAYEPVPKEMSKEDAKYVLGAQANVWTEYMLNTKKVEYMIFPRLSALSEVLWSPKEKRNWSDFEKRLLIQFKRYEKWKANYSKAYFDLSSTILPGKNNDGLLWKVETRQPEIQIKYITHFAGRPYELSFAEGKPYTSPVEIKSTQLIAAISMEKGKPVSNPVYQNFFFNKATGKKITLTNPPSAKYSGDGAITLVNGVINDKGRARSNEFLGFDGTDCEAMIDLGTAQKINDVKVHVFHQPDDQIWRPQYIEIFSSNDGNKFTSIGMTDDVTPLTGNGIMEKKIEAVTTRYIKVMIKNWGEIPEGNSGAGHKPWLFVDEIEIN
ncbi:MAG: family 20 glycosylhydrolase, partial [Bacteroidota bacterium]